MKNFFSVIRIKDGEMLRPFVTNDVEFLREYLLEIGFSHFIASEFCKNTEKLNMHETMRLGEKELVHVWKCTYVWSNYAQ